MVTVPRRFQLHRDRDVTGVSSTGIVADGVCWPDGTVTVRWRGQHASTVCWAGLADAMAVHGHGGHTRCVWLDPDPAAAPIAAPIVATPVPVTAPTATATFTATTSPAITRIRLGDPPHGHLHGPPDPDDGTAGVPAPAGPR